jgi:hypothetical protein
MRVRVVTYAPDALTRAVAARIRERFSAPRAMIRCAAMRVCWARSRRGGTGSGASCPEIEVDPPIGTVDALIVGAPLEGGASPRRCAHSSPVPTAFRRCSASSEPAPPRPALGFEDDVDR